MRAKRIAFVNAAWVNPTWLTLIRNNHCRVHGLIKYEEGLFRSLLSLLRDLSCGHAVTSPAQSNGIDGCTPVDRIKSICRDVLPSLCVCYLIHLRPDGTRTGRVNPTRKVQKFPCSYGCFKNEEVLLHCLSFVYRDTTSISQDGSTGPDSDRLGYKRSNSDWVYLI